MAVEFEAGGAAGVAMRTGDRLPHAVGTVDGGVGITSKTAQALLLCALAHEPTKARGQQVWRERLQQHRVAARPQRSRNRVGSRGGDEHVSGWRLRREL